METEDRLTDNHSALPGTFNPMQSFYDRLQVRPYYSDYKRIQGFTDKQMAVGYRYIQVNYPDIDYICFDLDYRAAAIRAAEVDVPGPTLTVVNPDNYHAHALYELYDPVPREHSKSTEKLLRDVSRGYKEMLCADRVITTQKQLVKNPLSDSWYVIAGYKPFTLSELAESIPATLDRRTFRPPNNKPLSVKPFLDTLDRHSRNCSLFDNARFYAYAVVNQHGSYDSLFNDVLLYIVHCNDVEIPKHFPHKLEANELNSIAKSIATWTYKHRNCFKSVNRGAMGFPAMTYWDPERKPRETKRRQKLSAMWMHDRRKETTDRKIEYGIEMCIKHGKELTVANISTLARVAKSTLYRHSYTQFLKVANGVSGTVDEPTAKSGDKAI